MLSVASHPQVCHGLLGHTAEDHYGGKLFTLSEQVGHHLSFVRDIPGPVVLVGHSIGSYIALEAKKDMPDKVARHVPKPEIGLVASAACGCF